MADSTIELILTEVIKLNSKFELLQADVTTLKTDVLSLKGSFESHFGRLHREMMDFGTRVVLQEKQLERHDRLLQGQEA